MQHKTLPSTGSISMAQVRTELGLTSGSLSLGDSRVRKLAGRTSGAISMADLRGKAAWQHTHTMRIDRFEYYSSEIFGYAKSSPTYNGNFGTLSPSTIDSGTVQHLVYDAGSHMGRIMLHTAITDMEVHIETECKKKIVFSKSKQTDKFFNTNIANANIWRDFINANKGKTVKLKIWTW